MGHGGLGPPAGGTARPAQSMSHTVLEGLGLPMFLAEGCARDGGNWTSDISMACAGGATNFARILPALAADLGCPGPGTPPDLVSGGGDLPE